MKNKIIGEYEIIDINAQVVKILRGLGNPEPPLDLLAVRDLLNLDRQYFSSTDTSALQEFVSRLWIAGRQIVGRPTLLLDVVRKAKLSALWLPDGKRILLDKDVPSKKHRWLEAHEICHGLLPWHGNYLLGDDEESLKPICREQLEAEANFAAGQLLFLQNRFIVEARDSSLSFESVNSLSKTFRNTLTSTLWRFVEEAHAERPMIGLVTPPTWDLPAQFDPFNPCRYCIESPAFKANFSRVTESELFRMISGYCRRRKGGPVGSDEVLLHDDNGSGHIFLFESFWNGYELLTLAVYQSPAKLLAAVS